MFLLAYDGSAPAQRALLHAADLLRQGDTMIVINVIPVQSVSARLETVDDEQRTRQAQILREATIQLARRDRTTTTIEAAGDPVTEILAAAQETKVDVIIVGRGASKRLLHRSVSSRLVRCAACDVLVVH